GEMPPDVVESIAIIDAVMKFLMGALTGEGGKGRADRDERIDAAIAAYTLTNGWGDVNQLHTSIVVKRSVDLKMSDDAEAAESGYFWYDLRDAERVVAQTAVSQDRVFDRLTWHLLEHFDA